jgi:hypothetical protein
VCVCVCVSTTVVLEPQIEEILPEDERSSLYYLKSPFELSTK